MASLGTAKMFLQQIPEVSQNFAGHFLVSSERPSFEILFFIHCRRNYARACTMKRNVLTTLPKIESCVARPETDLTDNFMAFGLQSLVAIMLKQRENA